MLKIAVVFFCMPIGLLAMVMNGCNTIELEQSKVKLNVKIDLNRTQPLRKTVWGLNTQIIWDKAVYHHKSFIKLYRQLGSPTARFPGGTPANWYYYKTGGVKLFAKGEHHKEAINKTTQLLQQNKEKIDINSFAAMIQKTKAPFILVLNMHYSENETLEYMNIVKSLGVIPYGIEMGNELYFSYYSNAFSPESYLKKAAKLSKKIHEVFPDMPISLLVHSAIYSQMSFFNKITSGSSIFKNQNNQRAYEWNKAIASATLNYQAISVHTYGPIVMNQQELFHILKNDDNVSELTSADASNLNAFLKYSFAYSDQQFPKYIDYLKKNYKNKEIWVTEYSSKSFKRDSYRKSWWGTFYSIDYLMKLFKEPAIFIANWHNLPYLFGTENYKKHGCWELFHQFAKPISSSSEIASVEIKNQRYFEAPKGKLFNGIGRKTSEINSIFFKGSRKGYLFLLNRQNTAYSLDKLTVAGSKKYRIENVNIVVPENFHKSKLIKSVCLKSYDGCVIDLPPLSLTRITIEY